MDKEEIIQAIKLGHNSQRKLAKFFRKSQGSIRHWLKKLNIEISDNISGNCSYCGSPLPIGRRKLCSDKCNQNSKSKKFYHNIINGDTNTKNKLEYDRKKHQKIKSNLMNKNLICSNCNLQFYSCCLSFHHTDPTTKLRSVSSVIRNEQFSSEEAKKCVVLCENCHREFHNPDKFIGSIDKKDFNYQPWRGIERKLELIKFFNSECKICGYKRNLSALEFHHINPSEKEFTLDSRHLSGRKWETLIEESKKCILLCANCHRQHHLFSLP